LNERKTVRHFICKRCEKPSKDLQGGFTQHSEKHDVDLVYENIDLCPKCFKKTNKEEKNLSHITEAINRGLIEQTDVTSLKRFQTDMPFRKLILEKCGIIKNNSVKEVGNNHPPSHYRRLARRKREREEKAKKEGKKIE
jgi:hypothetical protein